MTLPTPALQQSRSQRADPAPLREVAHSGSRFAQPGLWRAACAVLLATLAAAPTSAQDDAVERLVVADAARWVRHADPIVRGEAALVLAGAANPRYHAAIVQVARDPEPEARLRGLLALGLQASPGVVTVLDELLERQGDRTETAGLCAAWALGALPPDRAPAETARVLTSFVDGNWKRQGRTLLALLAGMSRHEQPDLVTALRQLYAVRSNRDPVIRAHLLGLLLPFELADEKRALELLHRADWRERRIVLEWLAINPTPFDAELIAPVERIASGGARPELRAAALAVLTRLRHPPAIELAAKALRSRFPVEAQQGMHSALAIGGASMRLALDRHLRDTATPELAAAMLEAWAAPPTTELLDHCAELASDRDALFDLRIAAATTLSQSDAARAAPMLRDLMRQADRGDDLRRLSRAIVAHSEPLPQLERLLPDPPDITLHPAHWPALLAAQHPGAIRRLLEILGSPNPPTAELRAALRAWRVPMVIGQLPDGGADLPAELRALLAPAGTE